MRIKLYNIRYCSNRHVRFVDPGDILTINKIANYSPPDGRRYQLTKALPTKQPRHNMMDYTAVLQETQLKSPYSHQASSRNTMSQFPISISDNPQLLIDCRSNVAIGNSIEYLLRHRTPVFLRGETITRGALLLK